MPKSIKKTIKIKDKKMVIKVSSTLKKRKAGSKRRTSRNMERNKSLKSKITKSINKDGLETVRVKIFN